MPEAKNPLTDRVKKMAAMLQAAKEVSEKVKEEQAREGQGETGQPSPSPEQSPS